LLNIVVFASGSGTNFQAIIDAVEAGQIEGRISGLITNKTDIQALERAKNNEIDYTILSPSQFSNPKEYVTRLLQQLESWNTDLIVLAGYMIKVPSEVIKQYKERIINIHPSLLPKYGGKGFFGMRVHEAVINNNESKSGCTVHFVTEKYDDGPVIAQQEVPVKKSDDASSLAKRVLKEEHKLLPKVIAKLSTKLNSKSNN
jgi:formyltetrahydrofolate-dependent phosphoribosylglycinamide formyltransferase